VDGIERETIEAKAKARVSGPALLAKSVTPASEGP
jgi:hypothetical protein